MSTRTMAFFIIVLTFGAQPAFARLKASTDPVTPQNIATIKALTEVAPRRETGPSPERRKGIDVIAVQDRVNGARSTDLTRRPDYYQFRVREILSGTEAKGNGEGPVNQADQ